MRGETYWGNPRMLWWVFFWYGVCFAERIVYIMYVIGHSFVGKRGCRCRVHIRENM
jgi:hypothetical protein